MPALLSVMMPVYNGAAYIREAVESILQQTFKDFELLIMDDGSIDETRGGFVVTWASNHVGGPAATNDGSGYGIYAQRVAADGSAVGGGFRVNAYVTDNQYLPTVTGLTDEAAVLQRGDGRVVLVAAGRAVDP